MGMDAAYPVGSGEPVEVVQIVATEDGTLVGGRRRDVKRYLRAVGLRAKAHRVPAERIHLLLRHGSQIVELASAVAAESKIWLWLTPEDAARVVESGLIPTHEAGVSYAMIGRPGASEPWLRVRDSPLRQSNPAALSRLAGFLHQLENEHQAQQLAAYLKRIDTKLSDVLDGQKIAEIASLKSAARTIKDLTIKRQRGPIAAEWPTPGHIETMITTALYWALDSLGDLVGKAKTRNIVATGGAIQDTEKTARQLLTVVAHCFKLLAQLDDLDLEVAAELSPDQVDRRRAALKETRADLLKEVGVSIRTALADLQAAGAKADLHAAVLYEVTRNVIGTYNRLGGEIDALSEPLGLPQLWRELIPTPRRKAIMSRKHMKTTLVDTAVGVGTAVSIGGLTLLANARWTSSGGADSDS